MLGVNLSHLNQNTMVKLNCYLRLALLSTTASQKQTIVEGIEALKIKLVLNFPNSGEPEVSSKTEPTAAIAAKQEINKNTLLFGVIFKI